MISFQNFPSSLGDNVSAWKIREAQVHELSNAAITLIVDSGSSMRLGVRYDRRRTGEKSIARLLERMEKILEAIPTNLDASVASLKDVMAASPVTTN